MTKIISEEEFWGEDKYGKIYPHLEVARPYKNLIKTISDYIFIKPNDIWLDVGCGSGSMIEMLWYKSNSNIKKIFAFDFSQVMIEHTKNRLKKLKNLIPSEKIELFQWDLSHKLPFNDDKFDGIVSNLVITYINQHEHYIGKEALFGILKELYRVLKPGASLVWSTPKKGVKFFYVFLASFFDMINPRQLEKLFYGPLILKHARYIEKKGKMGLYNFLSKDELMEILTKIGYNNTEITVSFAGQAFVVKSTK